MGRIAVIVHVYYRELWKELADCIANFPEKDTDVFVTIVSDDECFKAEILPRFPRANIRVVENRGYDVAPFLSVLRAVDLSQYEYVAKLHTKRNDTGWINYLPFIGAQCRRRLLSFCASKEVLDRSLRFLDRNPTVGMVAHPSLIVGRGDFQESENIKMRAEGVVQSCGYAVCRRRFVAGTMFLCRAKCLCPLLSVDGTDVFEFSSGETTMSDSFHVPGLAHVYERVFGYLTEAEGLRIMDVCRLLPYYDILYWVRMPAFYISRFVFRCTLKPVMKILGWRRS